MTTLTTSSKTYTKSRREEIQHLNPAIVVTHENQVFIWTDSLCKVICDVQVSEKTGNEPKQMIFDDDGFGLDQEVFVPDYISPNAVFVYNKKDKTYHVYSFGPTEYPYVLKYNLENYECKNINYEDPLDISETYRISDAAKTCVFGQNNEYIFITSKESELLIYSVAENKFLAKAFSLEVLLTNKERKDLSSQLLRCVTGANDSEYLCKVEEENDAAEFLMINDSYVTLLTIGYKNKKFVPKVKFSKNNFTNIDNYNKISKFGCLYFPAYETVMICGGIDENYESKKYVCFYHIRSHKFYFSTIRLPETMANHALVYIPKQNLIYIVPGATYVKTKPHMLRYSYYIKADAYKSILDACKKSMEKEIDIKKLNDKLKNNKN